MSIKRYRKQDIFSYTLGATLTIELLKKRPDLVLRVFYHSKTEQNEAFFWIEEICRDHHIPLENNDKAFNILSEKENCFVIGQFRKFDIKPDCNASHVVLVNPSNAGNLGTIIRTMVGFEINNLALIRPAVDIFDPKVVRASMGALFYLNFMYFDSFEEYQKYAGERNIYPFMLGGKESLIEVVFNNPYSLVFGNEASGLPNEFRNYGQTVLIKHSSSIDSLNLPVAVSIALYEATKLKF
ncbi:MAG: TrmH family RNA methyltransferase [Acholeplasmataceae bacterium]|jgi:TrmH family RNA methyltransferase|nr:TrmH family RNA methyltransferase [Acholeplasmataceae bacterium]